MKEKRRAVRLALCRGDLLAACLVLVAAAALLASLGMGGHQKAAAVRLPFTSGMEVTYAGEIH